jgi:hypothetical protein
MNILRSEQYATVPWRNGGGTTLEIASHRDPARHEDFLWRLSIATVAQPGPFSRFEGVDRTIALIDGPGMLLRSADGVVPIGAQTPPYAFRGETDIFCELPGGATIDFNVMTRRGFFQHSLRRERLAARTTYAATAGSTFVVVRDPMKLVIGEAAQGLEKIPMPQSPKMQELHALDTVIDIAAGTRFELWPAGQGEIFIGSLEASG